MMTVAEIDTIPGLRLIVCRAAQTDRLHWWDDQSLTPEGAFVAERLFGKRPRIASAKIALAAAHTRHTVAVPKVAGVVHLFDFGDEIEEELSSAPLTEDWTPSTPFASTDDFVLALRSIVTDNVEHEHAEPNQDGALEVRLSAKIAKKLNSTLALACVLALAYDSAKSHQPVFPFIKVETH